MTKKNLFVILTKKKARFCAEQRKTCENLLKTTKNFFYFWWFCQLQSGENGSTIDLSIRQGGTEGRTPTTARTLKTEQRALPVKVHGKVQTDGNNFCICESSKTGRGPNKGKGGRHYTQPRQRRTRRKKGKVKLWLSISRLSATITG